MAWGTPLSRGGARGRESPRASLPTTLLTHTQPPSSTTHFLCPLPPTQVLLGGASAVWKPHPAHPPGTVTEGSQAYRKVVASDRAGPQQGCGWFALGMNTVSVFLKARGQHLSSQPLSWDWMMRGRGGSSIQVSVPACG